MDPDATLERLLGAIHDYRRLVWEGEHDDPIIVAADEMYEAIADLEHWLSRGGALPQRWADRAGE